MKRPVDKSVKLVYSLFHNLVNILQLVERTNVKINLIVM